MGQPSRTFPGGIAPDDHPWWDSLWGPSLVGQLLRTILDGKAAKGRHPKKNCRKSEVNDTNFTLSAVFFLMSSLT